MTVSPAVRIDGLDRFVRQLNKLDPAITDELKVGNREQAEAVADVARAKSPRRDGDLVGSIRAGSTKRSGVVRAGRARVPYAGPVHFGWPAHRIRPRPFLWDALDDRRSAIEADYLERITKLAESVK